MNLQTNDLFKTTVIPSILSFLVGVPNTVAAHDFVNISTTHLVTCQGSIDSKYCNLIKKVESYKSLKYNWDGYEGTAPSEEVISFAISIIQELQTHHITAPKAMVSGKGEIALFWKEKNKYIEISLEEGHQSSYFVKNGTNIFGEENCFQNNKIPDNLMNTLVMGNARNTMDVPTTQFTSTGELRTTNGHSFLTA